MERGRHAGEKCHRIELAAHNIIGALVEDGDTPVADKRYTLIRVSCFDGRAQFLGVPNMMLAIDVDEHEIVSVRLSFGESLVMSLGRLHVVPGYTQDLVAYRPKYFPTTNMEHVCLRMSDVAGWSVKHD
jgi:hypothetical protein